MINKYEIAEHSIVDLSLRVSNFKIVCISDFMSSEF